MLFEHLLVLPYQHRAGSALAVSSRLTHEFYSCSLSRHWPATRIVAEKQNPHKPFSRFLPILRECERDKDAHSIDAPQIGEACILSHWYNRRSEAFYPNHLIPGAYQKCKTLLLAFGKSPFCRSTRKRFLRSWQYLP